MQISECYFGIHNITKGRLQIPQSRKKSARGGGTPLSVNFFPLTFWPKNSVFWVKNKKNAACGEKFLDFWSVKGGGGYPPFPLSFFR